MPEILWWLLGILGLLLLLVLLWLAYHAVHFWRLGPVVVRFLSLPDVDLALDYIDQHPRLLHPTGERIIRTMMESAWANGEADLFVSGLIHWLLLNQCRAVGVETVRQTLADRFQDWLTSLQTPVWQRALQLLGDLGAHGKMNIAREELDEELVAALETIMTMLRPLGDEKTQTITDEILQELRQILERKAQGALPPAQGTAVKAKRRQRKHRQ